MDRNAASGESSERPAAPLAGGAAGVAAFAISSPGAFYASLLARYWRRFALMMGLSLVYAGVSSSRIAVGGFLVDAVRVRFQPDHDPGKPLRLLDQVIAWFDPESVVTPQLKGDPEFLMTFLLLVTAGFGVAMVAMTAASFFKDYLTQSLIVHMVVDLRTALFDHLSLQSVAYFNRQRAGDVISRLTNDVNAVQLSFRFYFETICHEPLIILGSLAMALWASPLLFVLVVPLLGLVTYPVFRSGKKVIKHGRGRLEKLGLVTEAIQQLFTGIRIVKAFCMEGHERREFRRRNEEYIRSTMKMNKAKIKGATAQELLYNVGVAGLALAGAWLLLNEVLGIEDFVMFVGGMLTTYRPLKSLARAWNQIQESTAGVERVLEVLSEAPRLTDRDGALEFPGVRERIGFEGVGFSYESRGEAPAPAGSSWDRVPPIDIAVLRGVSFEVRAGDVTGIVGPSGAGKSTVVDLLARFYDPLEGRITVDGRDIREFRHASYLWGIAIVSQDPFLFNATIRENILYGRPQASHAEVEEAARVAFAHDFIMEQPDGYDTSLGERGVLLSGGQRQRITIARAVLKNAPILILDEATSALDSFAEKEVQKAMENLMRERTTFVVAHRLSTVAGADRILVFDGGRLVESGAHEDLLARGGTYSFLWRSQNPEGEGVKAGGGR
jgi:subfamily B ATP-binding cassette protein MsbA